MARIRTGYVRDELGNLRRDPSRDLDIGVAAAHVDGLVAASRLRAFAGDQKLVALDESHAMGAGPVTRRQATPEELARLASESRTSDPGHRPSPAMHQMRQPARVAVVPDAARVQASRLRGGQRLQEIRAAAAPETAPIHHEEESVTATASPATPGLSIDASSFVYDRPFPCNDCIHAPVCRLREDVTGFQDGAAMYESILLDEPGIRLRFDVVCDHHVPVDRIPVAVSETVEITVEIAAAPEPVAQALEAEPIRAEHGGESWRTPLGVVPEPSGSTRYPLPRDRAERDRVVLEALRTQPSTMAAAKVLGVSDTRVTQIIRELRTAGAMPEDVDQLLVARQVVRSQKAAS